MKPAQIVVVEKNGSVQPVSGGGELTPVAPVTPAAPAAALTVSTPAPSLARPSSASTSHPSSGGGVQTSGAGVPAEATIRLNVSLLDSLMTLAGELVLSRNELNEAVGPYLDLQGFTRFLAIQTFYAGARRIGAAQAALVSTVEPVYIVVLAAVFLDQHLEPVQLAGAALILVGVVIAQTGPRPRGAPEPATPLEGELSDPGPPPASTPPRR